MYSSFITVDGGFKACVYAWNDDENIVFIYTSEQVFPDEFAAIEAADNYCEDNNIEAETDFSGDPE